ncbi:uncharacterized protein LOC100141540 isoform X1 [Tribolium castaneum]|uniref:Uncharacterized protein n=3 Tax=Tribolium castaneum TaxID=7070 RepID=A0A139WL76_TRICA|nr:PREDICTED: uncharacterized protein LOC100141540 isoform X1 [Tribolium castaneum]KYB28634.1 hypothetical protein TcasGA2_TC032378 [Tribolium castaneum]|eukprot:XP_008190894.1 PREDICTED: uncharacterized protein LOC100141540 isoform X1 [Tribolium castaneum]
MALYMNTVKQLGFKDFIHQKGKGRISISRQLLKAHCDGYHPHISRQLATELQRYIKSQPKRDRRSSGFVDEIRRKIIHLHEYNLQIANVKLRYPRSEQLEALLIKYIELECELLYGSAKEVDKKHEESVTTRVLRLLRVIVHDSFHNSESDLNSTVKICYKTLLKFYASVRVDFDCENNLVANTIINLVDKLGVGDTINALKGEYIPLPEDSFLTNSKVKTVRQSLRTSDYESDFDSKSDDEHELSMVDDLFNPKPQKPSMVSTEKFNFLPRYQIKSETKSPSIFTNDKSTYSLRNEVQTNCTLFTGKLNNHVDNTARKQQNLDVPKNSDAKSVSRNSETGINAAKSNEDNSQLKLSKSDQSVSTHALSNSKEHTNRENKIATIEILDDDEETLDVNNSNGQSQLPSNAFGNFLPVNEIKLEENEENHSPNYSVSNSENQNFLNSNKETRNSGSTGLNRLKNSSGNDSVKDTESSILISDSEDESEPGQAGAKKINDHETNDNCFTSETNENVEQPQVEEIVLNKENKSSNNIQKDQLSDSSGVESDLTQDEDQTLKNTPVEEETDTTLTLEETINNSPTTPEKRGDLDFSVEVPEEIIVTKEFDIPAETNVAEIITETAEVVLEHHKSAEETLEEVTLQTETETAAESDVSEAILESLVENSVSEAVVETIVSEDVAKTVVSEATIETEISEDVETMHFEAVVETEVTPESEVVEGIFETTGDTEETVETAVGDENTETVVETVVTEEIAECNETEVGEEISDTTLPTSVTEEIVESNVATEVVELISGPTVRTAVIEEIPEADVEREVAEEIPVLETTVTEEIAEVSIETEYAHETSDAMVETVVLDSTVETVVTEAHVTTEEISEATAEISEAIETEVPEIVVQTEDTQENFTATPETEVTEEVSQGIAETEATKENRVEISEKNEEVIDFSVTKNDPGEELTNNKQNSATPEILSSLELVQTKVLESSEDIQSLNTHSDVLAQEQTHTTPQTDAFIPVIDYSIKMQTTCDIITTKENQFGEVSQSDLHAYGVNTQCHNVLRPEMCQETQGKDGVSQQLPTYELPQSLSEVQYVEYDSPKKDAALAMLADLAFQRKTLEVETNKKNGSDMNLQTIPKRRKSTKEKLEVKNPSSRKSLPRAVKQPQRRLKGNENKKIIRKNLTKSLDSIVENEGPLKLVRNEDPKYIPHDFISLKNSNQPPLTNKVYAEELQDNIPTSEDSNDSCANKLCIDEETIPEVCVKSVDKNKIFDEDTIPEVFEFVTTESASAVCISIPEIEENRVLESSDILKQMEDFVKKNDNVLTNVVNSDQPIELTSPSVEKPETKVLKTTDHSIVNILNRTPNADAKIDTPAPELPENLQQEDEATTETPESADSISTISDSPEKSSAKSTDTVGTPSDDGRICNEVDEALQLGPRDLTVGMATVVRSEDSCEKIFKTKAQMKAYEDKLQPNPFVLLMNYEKCLEQRTKRRSKSSEGKQQPASCLDRGRSSSVDFTSSDLPFNKIKESLRLDKSTVDKIQALSDKTAEIAKDSTEATNTELVQENTQSDNLENTEPVVTVDIETTREVPAVEAVPPKPACGEVTVSLVIDVAEKLANLPVSDEGKEEVAPVKSTDETLIAEDLSQKPVDLILNAKETCGSVSPDKTNSKTLDATKGRSLENTIKKMKEKMESEKVKKEKRENSANKTKSNNLRESEKEKKSSETSKKDDKHHKRRRSRSSSKSRSFDKKSDESSRSSSKSKTSDKRSKEKHSDSESERLRRSKSKSVDSQSHEEPNGHRKRHHSSSSKPKNEDAKSRQSSEKVSKHKSSESKDKSSVDSDKRESKSSSELKDKQSEDSENKKRKSHETSEKKHKSKNEKPRDKENEEKVKSKTNTNDDVKKKPRLDKSVMPSDDILFKVDEKVSKTVSKKVSKTQEDSKKLADNDNKHSSHKTKLCNSGKVNDQGGKNNGRVNEKEKSKSKEEDKFRRSSSKEKKVENDKRDKRSRETDSLRHKNKATECEGTHENKGKDRENSTESKASPTVRESKHVSKQKDDIHKKRKSDLLEDAPLEKISRLENERIPEDVNMERPKTPTICLFGAQENDSKSIELQGKTHSENKTDLDIPLPLENLTESSEPVGEVAKSVTPVVTTDIKMTTAEPLESIVEVERPITPVVTISTITLTTVEPLEPVEEVEKPVTPIVTASDVSYDHFKNDMRGVRETPMTSTFIESEKHSNSAKPPINDSLNASNKALPDDKIKVFDPHLTSAPEIIIESSSPMKMLLQNDNVFVPSSEAVSVSGVFSSTIGDHVLSSTVDSTVKHFPDLSLVSTTIANSAATKAVSMSCDVRPSSSSTTADQDKTCLFTFNNGETVNRDNLSTTEIFGLDDISPTKLPPLGSTQSLDFISPTTSTAEISTSMNLLQTLGTSTINFMNEVPDTSGIDVQTNKQNSFHPNYVTRVTEISCFGEKESAADHNYTLGGPLLGGNNEERTILTTGLSLSNSPDDFPLNAPHLDELSFSENNYIEENETLGDMELLLPCKKEKPDFDTDDPIPKPEDVQNEIKRLNMLVDISQSEPKTTSVRNTIDHGSNSDLGTDYAVEQLELLSQVVGDINNINIMDSNVSSSDAMTETTSHDPINLPLIWNSYSNFISSDGNQKVVVEPVEQCSISTVDHVKKDFINGTTPITVRSNKFPTFVEDETKVNHTVRKNRMRVVSPEKSATMPETGKIRVKTDLIAKSKSENGQEQIKPSKPPLGCSRLSKFAPLLEALSNRNKTDANKNETSKALDETEKFLARRHNRTRVSTPKQNIVTQQRHSKSPPLSKKPEIVSFDIDVTKPQKMAKIQVKTDLKAADITDVTGNFQDKKVEEHKDSSTKHKIKDTLEKNESKVDDGKKRALVEVEEDKKPKKLKEGRPHPRFDETGKDYIMENILNVQTETKKTSLSASADNHVEKVESESTKPALSSTDDIFDKLRREGPVNKLWTQEMLKKQQTKTEVNDVLKKRGYYTVPDDQPSKTNNTSDQLKNRGYYTVPDPTSEQQNKKEITNEILKNRGYYTVPDAKKERNAPQFHPYPEAEARRDHKKAANYTHSNRRPLHNTDPMVHTSPKRFRKAPGNSSTSKSDPHSTHDYKPQDRRRSTEQMNNGVANSSETSKQEEDAFSWIHRFNGLFDPSPNLFNTGTKRKDTSSQK